MKNTSKKQKHFNKKLYDTIIALVCFILGILCTFLLIVCFGWKTSGTDIKYIIQDETSHIKAIVCNSCGKAFINNVEPHKLDENNTCTQCAYGRELDLSKYESYVSYAGMNEDGESIAREIVNAINNPNEYEEVSYNGTSHIIIRYPKAISKETYYRICAFFVHYFGDFNIWVKEYGRYNNVAINVFDAEIFHNENTTIIYIPSDGIPMLQEKRNTFVKQAEAVLVNLQEGSETDMLLQISDYLNTHIRYRHRDNNPSYTCEEFWNNREGYCLLYAMAFRQLAERLGIPCDVVVGYTAAGEYHAWNRVRLLDGAYRYYDMTMNLRNAESSPHEECWINCYVNSLNK